MHEEDAFVRALMASRGDDTPRLIYADWLEERGDLDRASFLRLGIAQRRRESDDDFAPDHSVELHRLLAQIDPDWLALISQARRFGVIWSPEDLDYLEFNTAPRGQLDRIWFQRLVRGSPVGASLSMGDQIYAIVRDEETWQLAGRILYHRQDFHHRGFGPREQGRSSCQTQLIGIQGSPIRTDRWLPGEMAEWFSFRTYGGQHWWSPEGRGAAYLRRHSLIELAPSTAAVLDRVLLGWISPGAD